MEYLFYEGRVCVCICSSLQAVKNAAMSVHRVTNHTANESGE